MQSLKMGIEVASVGRVAPPTVQVIRETWAAKIGLILVIIFGATVLYLFTYGIILLLKFHATSNGDFTVFVRDALDPFLKECATTLGTIFGSTLGFVLGYYFKEASAIRDGK